MSLEVDPDTLRVVQISTGSVRRANIYDTQVGVVVCGFDANARCSARRFTASAKTYNTGSNMTGCQASSERSQSDDSTARDSGAEMYMQRDVQLERRRTILFYEVRYLQQCGRRM